MTERMSVDSCFVEIARAVAHRATRDPLAKEILSIISVMHHVSRDQGAARDEPAR